MASEGHINVTVIGNGTSVDLRIPTRITVCRLIDELEQLFPGLSAGQVRYQLRVPTRGLLLTERDQLSAFPVASGDILELI